MTHTKWRTGLCTAISFICKWFILFSPEGSWVSDCFWTRRPKAIYRISVFNSVLLCIAQPQMISQLWSKGLSKERCSTFKYVRYQNRESAEMWSFRFHCCFQRSDDKFLLRLSKIAPTSLWLNLQGTSKRRL